MNKKKIGIIGLGRQVLKEHIPAIVTSGDFEVSAVCDPDPARYDELCKTVEVRPEFFTNVDEFLKSLDSNLVIISVPHDQYLPIIQKCARAGKHILKEKPFARSGEEAEKLLSIAKEHNIVIMTTFQRRFHPLYRAFKTMLKELGEIASINALYTIPSQAPNSGWRGNSVMAGGGVLLDMGYHVLDELFWLFDIPVDRTFSVQSVLTTKVAGNEYDVEDTALFTFTIDRVIGSAFIAVTYPIKHDEVVVVGSNGSAYLSKLKIVRYNKRHVAVESLECNDGWLSAMINQLNYFNDVVNGTTDLQRGLPEFQIENHVRHMDSMYKMANAAISQRLLTPKQ